MELSITTESLPQATLGEAYSTSLEASGTGSFTWSYTGALPGGLSLSSDGELSGIPTESGTFSFSVSVFDSYGATAQTQLTLTIVAVIQDIAAGDEHTCALYNDGRIKCWGYNDKGQLGDNSTDASATPVNVFGVTTAVSIAAGSDNTCARLEDGSTVCWGSNASSQLGNGTSSSSLDYSTTPVQVSELSDTTAISVGSGASCALEPGAVSCWGAQATDSTNQINTTPVPVTGFDGTPTSVSGGYTACALISGGDVQCWGGNYYGLLGDNTNDTSTTPVSVQGLTAGAQQVEIGAYHACAVINGGSLQCWGDNYYDQLGVTGDTVAESWVARTVSGVSGVASVAVGSGSTCVLSNAGTVSCFGRNDCYSYPCGIIGSDSVLKSAEPVSVWSGSPAAKAITLGSQHGCALLVSGEVVCWGDNYSLQLGQEGVTISAEPLTVPGL
jgi:alpha-tubulin suppressor-like RCC1 family protein